MIVLNDELLIRCREYGLKTINEVNKFVKKYGINNNDELEKVLNGEISISAITAIDERALNKRFIKIKKEENKE